MVEPVSTALSLAKVVGPALAPRLRTWMEGSEARRLVKLLKADHPAAPKLLLQPAVLLELWWYSTTGELREPELLAALRPIVADERERRALADAIRTTQWRAMHDEAQRHFELLRLQHDLEQAHKADHAVLLRAVEAAVERALARLRPQLETVRGLPAEADPFVDREPELAAAAACILPGDAEEASARVVTCSGMPGVGSSALGLRLAHQHAKRFPGGALYANFRRADGSPRSAADVAAQLLRELGVAPDVIPVDADAQLATLRSLLAEAPVLMLLDNVRHEQDVRPLIPANRASAVVATSRVALTGIGVATPIGLSPLGDADAIALLRRLLGARVEREPDAARQIARDCHGLPLALALAGARLRRRPQLRLADYARQLAGERQRVAHLADGERALSATFAASTSGLAEPARRLLLLLAALHVGTIETSLCAALLDCDEVTASAALERLEEEGLLMSGPDGGRAMHELLRLWARERAEQELAPHLIASARDRKVGWLVEAAQDPPIPRAPVED